MENNCKEYGKENTEIILNEISELRGKWFRLIHDDPLLWMYFLSFIKENKKDIFSFFIGAMDKKQYKRFRSKERESKKDIEKLVLKKIKEGAVDELNISGTLIGRFNGFLSKSGISVTEEIEEIENRLRILSSKLYGMYEFFLIKTAKSYHFSTHDEREKNIFSFEDYYAECLAAFMRAVNDFDVRIIDSSFSGSILSWARHYISFNLYNRNKSKTLVSIDEEVDQKTGFMLSNGDLNLLFSLDLAEDGEDVAEREFIIDRFDNVINLSGIERYKKIMESILSEKTGVSGKMDKDTVSLVSSYVTNVNRYVIRREH